MRWIMTKLKKLVSKESSVLSIEMPITETEIESRYKDYFLLSPMRFSNKYKGLLFAPISFTYQNKSYKIQMNTCVNPYCKWFGMPQERFLNIPNKPSRYKLDDDSKIKCNHDPIRPDAGMTWGVRQPYIQTGR